MRKTTLAWICFLFLLSQTYLHALEMGTLKSRGLYGSVEYGYTQENSSDTINKSSQNSMIQNYTLGKTGSIYSPNLLSYLLQGSLYMNDTESTTNNSEAESSNKNLNYRINTDFIRATKYPFSLYTEKTSNPYGSVQAGSAINYNQTNDRYGISGSVELPYFAIRYSAESSEMERDESFADETRSNEDYTLSIYKKFDEGTLSAVYNNRFRDYSRDDRYFNSTQEWSDHSQEARLNGQWDMDKTLRIGSYLTYMDSSYSDMKNLSGSVNLNWRPSDVYSAGLDFTANTIESGEYKNDTLMLSGNSSYQMTPEFSTTQNISLYNVSGDYLDQTMGTVTISGYYTKPMENNLVLTVGGDLMVKTEQNSVAEDLNITMPDRNTYAFTVSAGASKMIESIDSTLSANLSYYNSTSSLNEESQRISANMMLSSTIMDNLYYTLSGYYTTEESEYYAGSEAGIIKRDSEVVTIDNALRYWQDVGYDGKLSLGGGVAYSITETDQSERVDRVFPHLDGSFSYRFFQAVFFNSTLSASQDSVSDLTNYSAYMGLNYTLRKIMMSLGTRYLYQTGGTLVESTQSSAFFKISRTF